MEECCVRCDTCDGNFGYTKLCYYHKRNPLCTCEDRCPYCSSDIIKGYCRECHEQCRENKEDAVMLALVELANKIKACKTIEEAYEVVDDILLTDTI